MTPADSLGKRPTVTPLPNVEDPVITVTAKATSTVTPLPTLGGVITEAVKATSTPVPENTLPVVTQSEVLTEPVSDPVYPAVPAPALKFDFGGNSFVFLTADTVSFASASDAASVVVPDQVVYGGKTYRVTSIADKAFMGRKKLKKVKIGKHIETIGKQAFAGCTSLKKITIPAAVRTIGASAFSGDKKLSSVTVKSTKLTKKSVGKNAFKGISSKAVFKLNKSNLKTYKKFLKKKGIPSKTVFKRA